jgi:hypothetical protein
MQIASVAVPRAIPSPCPSRSPETWWNVGRDRFVSTADLVDHCSVPSCGTPATYNHKVRLNAFGAAAVVSLSAAWFGSLGAALSLVTAGVTAPGLAAGLTFGVLAGVAATQKAHREVGGMLLDRPGTVIFVPRSGGCAIDLRKDDVDALLAGC